MSVSSETRNRSADKIVGYYVTGPSGREDFRYLHDAQAAYDALEGQPRAIGRWRQRRSPDQPLLLPNGQLIQRTSRSRYGDLIEREGPEA